MNKKAFVLMETIVVIVVISVALLTIFASYNKILSKVKTENKYDTSEYIYMTNYIKEKLLECNGDIDLSNDIFAEDITNSVIDLYYENKCDIKTKENGVFNIKKIYVLTNINGGDDSKFKKFDAYMIDYIRKLDVLNSDKLIIVEYSRNALDDKGELLRPTECNASEKENIAGIEICKPLTDTYIASLEWN